MRIYPGRLMILAIIGVFVFASGNSLMASGSITEQEAIEICRRSELVRENLRVPSYISVVVKTNYYDFSMIKQMKEQILKEIPYEIEDAWPFKVPEGHSVWEVTWYIRSRGPGVLYVSVYVDAETERIIDEEIGRGWI